MEFKKKMKQRFVIALSYILLGIVLLAAAFAGKSDNYFFSAFGFALMVMGALRLLRYRKVTASEQTMRKQELTESDERIRMMAERARSWAFSLSVTISGIVVIVLSLLGMHDAALPFSWFVCGMVVLYWICWMIIRRKY